ncbi:hypothetical protein [Kitasatospora sp. NPDC057223]|uniref:hypothetical protein n=1 Tax=Kitasatospora sp. NPDC057223 TaxID=3346055 RepID=UPI0036404D4E
MSTAAHQPEPYTPAMGTLPELRAALAGLASLGLPDELAAFEDELARTPLDQVPALADRYRDYLRRNTSPEAVSALTITPAASAAELRRKIAEAGR